MYLSLIKLWPPAPHPKMTPTSVRFSSVSSNPESASACFAAGGALMLGLSLALGV